MIRWRHNGKACLAPTETHVDLVINRTWYEIMLDYDDSAFDFVDTAIMALAERLNIETVYTLDRRDFGIFRPRHCKFLKVLP
jgi:predicted nucleic acid-binding protein